MGLDREGARLPALAIAGHSQAGKVTYMMMVLMIIDHDNDEDDRVHIDHDDHDQMMRKSLLYHNQRQLVQRIEEQKMLHP